MAPPAVRASLDRGLRLSAVLGRYGGVSWLPAPPEWRPLDDTGLQARAIPLRGAGWPRYDREGPEAEPLAVGYQFRLGAAVAGVFPDVAVLDEPLRATLAECDRAWFDGTFWSEDEMLPFNGRTASAMGHVPVEVSLPVLAALGSDRVAYLHVNNSNPLLRPDSAERRAVEAAGLRVAEDGERVVVSAR